MSNSKVVDLFEQTCISHQPAYTYKDKTYSESTTIWGFSREKDIKLKSFFKSFKSLTTGVDGTPRAVVFGFLSKMLSANEQKFGQSSDSQLPNFKVTYYYTSNAKRVYNSISIL